MIIESIGTTSTDQLVLEISTTIYHTWIGVSGYDTRPYIPAIGKGAYLPCNCEVGYAENGKEDYTVEATKKEVEEVIKGLHASMKAIVIPDYYGMNHEGDYVFTPRPDGWHTDYLPA